MLLEAISYSGQSCFCPHFLWFCWHQRLKAKQMKICGITFWKKQVDPHRIRQQELKMQITIKRKKKKVSNATSKEYFLKNENKANWFPSFSLIMKTIFWSIKVYNAKVALFCIVGSLCTSKMWKFWSHSVWFRRFTRGYVGLFQSVLG